MLSITPHRFLSLSTAFFHSPPIPCPPLSITLPSLPITPCLLISHSIASYPSPPLPITPHASYPSPQLPITPRRFLSLPMLPIPPHRFLSLSTTFCPCLTAFYHSPLLSVPASPLPISPISAKASLVVWRVDKKYRIEDIFRFRSVFTQFFLKCLLYLGLAADVTSSTKTRLCLSYRSTTCFLNNFDFRTCNTWHRKLYIPWNLLWQMRLIYLISKIISCVRLFAVPEEFSFPEDLVVFLTVIMHIWPWL